MKSSFELYKYLKEEINLFDLLIFEEIYSCPYFLNRDDEDIICIAELIKECFYKAIDNSLSEIVEIILYHYDDIIDKNMSIEDIINNYIY